MKKYRDGEYDYTQTGLYFECTGEFRCPRKGERYLSGAIPAAYRAPNDLGTPFHILRLAASPEKTIVVNGYRYRLEGPA